MKRQSFLIVTLIAFTFWGLVGATSGSQGNINPDNELILDQYQAAPGWDDEVEPSVVANLLVEDMERSLTFYRDSLGFEVKMQMPAEGSPEWVMLGVAGKDLIALQQRESLEAEVPEFKGRKTGGTFVLYASVSSAAEVYNRVKDKVKIYMALVKKPYGMEEFTAADPDGYLITFGSEIEAAE